MMKIRPLRTIILLSLILRLVAPIPSLERAAASGLLEEDPIVPPCYSLDVLFLVDQSPSMSQNDPHNLRRDSIHWVIDWLGDNVLTTCREAGVAHIIGVIGFTGIAWTALKPSIIAPVDWNTWLLDRARLKDELDAGISPPSGTGGGTMPKPAFIAANEMFNRISSLGRAPHKRLIIFLTDGQPCAGVGGTPSCDEAFAEEYARQLSMLALKLFPFNENLLNQEKCLDQARGASPDGQLSAEARYECLSQYPVKPEELDGSNYIWTILLNNNQSYGKGFKSEIDTMTGEHAGETHPLVYNSDIPVMFLRIMTELVGVSADRITCGIFPMEPYLQQATLTFFKLNPNITVNMSYERDGQAYKISQEDVQKKTMPLALDGYQVLDYTQDSTIERYVFRHPRAGQWMLSASDCQGIQAYFEPLELSSNLSQVLTREIPQMDLPPYYDIANPVYIEFFVLDKTTDGGRVEQDPLFPVTIAVDLTRPDGTVQQFNLAYDEERVAFSNTEPLNVALPGKYYFSIRATTPYADPDKQREGDRLLLEEGPITFKVTTVAPFIYKMKISQDVIPQVDIPPYYEEDYPVYIEYILSDSLGRQHQAGVDQRYPIIMQATLTRPDGSVEKLDLIYVPELGVFRTKQPLNVSLTGDYTIKTDASISSLDTSGGTGAPRVLFIDGPNTFNVRTVTPFMFSIVKPENGSRYALHEWQRLRLPLNTVQFKVALKDLNGNLLDPLDVLLDPTFPLSGTLSANGVTATVILLRDPENPGYYINQARVIDFTGPQSLSISFDGTYRREAYRPEYPVQDKVIFNVRDTLFTNPTTPKGVIILVIIVIILLVFYNILIRTNPLKGELVFSHYDGGEIANLSLNSGKNTKVVGGRTLSAYPQLDLKRIKARFAGRRAKLEAGEQDILESIEGFSAGAQPGVRIEFTTGSKTRFTETLQPNTPIPYSAHGEDNLFQVEYRNQ